MSTINQISIFLENKPGRLAKVTEVLARNNINIHALSLADTSDFGILRLIVSDTATSKEALKSAGFTAGITPVIAAAMPDSPGGLDHILQTFGKNDINIEYMYAFVGRAKGEAVLVFRCQNAEAALKILGALNIRVLTEKEISG